MSTGDLTRFTDDELEAELERRSHSVCLACGQPLTRWLFLGRPCWTTDDGDGMRCRAHPIYESFVKQQDAFRAQGIDACGGPFPEHQPRVERAIGDGQSDEARPTDTDPIVAV